jgi:hypothetical protein
MESMSMQSETQEEIFEMVKYFYEIKLIDAIQMRALSLKYATNSLTMDSLSAIKE